MGRAEDLHCANRKWNTSDLRLGFLVRCGKRRRKKRQRREREWRKASVSRQREERPRESGWISFFPLEEIFTFSSVDYHRRRRRRRPFKRVDARSGGKEGGTPRVSVSTWTFVRGRRNASFLSSCRLSNPWRNIPFGSPFPSLASLLSIRDKDDEEEEEEEDDVERGNRRRLRSLRDNVLSASRQ